MHNNQQFNEGLENGDLARLIHPDVHVDEFKSKMGDDADVVVVSFKVIDKEPALDLVNFIEKGYDFVLDADVSSGELDDGEYLVFVELDRKPEVADQILTMVDDFLNLTGQDIGEWSFKYRSTGTPKPLTAESLVEIPRTPEEYLSKFGSKDLDAMQESARVPMNRRAPVNEYTESLRVAAGLK